MRARSPDRCEGPSPCEEILVKRDNLKIVRVTFMGKLGLLSLLSLTAACHGQSPTDSPAAPQPKATAVSGPDGPIASPEPDWPQWRGPRRDGISDEKGLLAHWPVGGPRLRWKIGNLGHGWTSPIIVGDRIYITGDVGDDLVLYAFDLDGKPLWKTTNGRAWTGPYPGARACCTYSEGKLYHMNAHGRAVCLDLATGREHWVVDLQERFQASVPTWGFSECLLVDGPRVIVTPGSSTTLMAALDKQTGQTVWTSQPLEEPGASYSSPVLFQHAGHRIVANCGPKNGFGVDADSGRLLWTVPLRSPYGVNVTTPVYGAGQVFYVTAYFCGACYQLQPDDQGVTAKTAWDTTLDTCTGAVLLIGHVLYGSGYQKHKSWLGLDWKSGATRCELKDFAPGSAVYADGHLYCLSQDGRAALLRLATDQITVDGQFRFMPQKVSDAWSYPVVFHGRLFLRYHDVFCCYDVRASNAAER
jgi:outer membrane protein assembly factor BamB